MLQTVQEVMTGEVPFIPQTTTEAELKHAPKLFKEHCRIDWHQTAQSIHNHVRGLSPYPAAFTQVNGLGLKIYSVRPQQEVHDLKPGQGMLLDGRWRVAVPDGFVELLEVQLEGKKRIPVAEFLKGNAALAELPLG